MEPMEQMAPTGLTAAIGRRGQQARRDHAGPRVPMVVTVRTGRPARWDPQVRRVPRARPAPWARLALTVRMVLSARLALLVRKAPLALQALRARQVRMVQRGRPARPDLPVRMALMLCCRRPRGLRTEFRGFRSH